jgi:hypothetical protein
VVLNKRTFNQFGVAIDFPFCPAGSCEWEEKVRGEGCPLFRRRERERYLHVS